MRFSAARLSICKYRTVVTLQACVDNRFANLFENLSLLSRLVCNEIKGKLFSTSCFIEYEILLIVTNGLDTAPNAFIRNQTTVSSTLLVL
jgi:hypothetical protein